LVQIM